MLNHHILTYPKSTCIKRLLSSKLVARKGQNLETPQGEHVVQLHKLCIVPRGQASLGCHVHHKTDFAFEGGERDNLF